MAPIFIISENLSRFTAGPSLRGFFNIVGNLRVDFPRENLDLFRAVSSAKKKGKIFKEKQFGFKNANKQKKITKQVHK